MTTSILHVAPGLSAQATMRMVVQTDNRSDEVIGLPDSLSLGPIDYQDPKVRSAWVEDVLGYAWDDVVEESERFWKRVLTTDKPRVLWFSRRSATEYTAFLEAVWRLGNASYSVMDVTDVPIVRRNERGEKLPPRTGACVSLIPRAAMLESGLLDKAVPISGEQKAFYLALWGRLRAENAPFRVVDAEGIHSAPITVFDELVRSCVIREWRTSARVIGAALGKVWESGYHQGGDWELFSRLRKLVALGRVENEGDMSDIRQSRVRLPPEDGSFYLNRER